MIEDSPSKTAVRVALRRAAHQVLDDPPVFADPFALVIAEADAATLERDPRNHSAFGRGLRAFMAARSRWAEDRLSEAVATGVRQYVVLGAGLDTFALRNPFPHLQVFEVDYPATQQLKQQRIKAAGFSTPAALTYVALDFARQTLADGLAAGGFVLERPAFFSWLGVVPYLVELAVFDTLRFVASVAAPTEVVFDYAIDPSLLSSVERSAVSALAERVAAAGEPFQTYLAPARLAAELHTLGFNAIKDLGIQEINQLYFDNRGDDLRLRGSAGRLVSARRI